MCFAGVYCVVAAAVLLCCCVFELCYCVLLVVRIVFAQRVFSVVVY